MKIKRQDSGRSSQTNGDERWGIQKRERNRKRKESHKKKDGTRLQFLDTYSKYKKGEQESCVGDIG